MDLPELEWDPSAGFSGVIVPISNHFIRKHLQLGNAKVDEKLIDVIEEGCSLATQLHLKEFTEVLFLIALWNKKREYFQSILNLSCVGRESFFKKVTSFINRAQHSEVFLDDISDDLKQDFTVSISNAKNRSDQEVHISDILIQISKSCGKAGVLFRENRICEQTIRKASVY